MQQRAGLLFLSKKTNRILLILENQTWTIPSFLRNNNLLDDAKNLLDEYRNGKIIPVELYVSKDNGFEFGTYVCLIDDEFLNNNVPTYCWCSIEHLPKNLHPGLKTTFTDRYTKVKIETILKLQDLI